MSSTGLTGSSAVVTGAGSGIGRAVALQLAGAGARVLVADINADAAKEVAAEIVTAGATSEVVVGDLSEQAVVDEVVATAVEKFDGLDILVNNAGVMDSFSTTADTTDSEWERLIRINLDAPFKLTRAAVPHMLAKGKGAIVNTASEASLRGSAAGTAYTVSKHGVLGLTKSTAIQYRDRGIRVNAVAPGGTETNIAVNADVDADGPAVIGSYRPNVGRIARVEELAAAIVFLASDAASNINGVILPVDNGWSAV